VVRWRVVCLCWLGRLVRVTVGMDVSAAGSGSGYVQYAVGF